MPAARLPLPSRLYHTERMNIFSRFEDVDSISAFADSARAVLQFVSPLSRLHEFRSALPRFDKHVWDRLAEAGWTSILAPEALAGC